MEILLRDTLMWVVELSTVRTAGMEPSVISGGIREQHKQLVTNWDTLSMVRMEVHLEHNTIIIEVAFFQQLPAPHLDQPLDNLMDQYTSRTSLVMPCSTVQG